MIEPAPTAADADGYRLEDQVGYVLRRAHQRSSGLFAEVMAPFDVTPTQFAAMAKLVDVGSVSQNELGRLTAMDTATVAGVVGRLVKRGWVRQRIHPDDGRRQLLDLTEAGEEAARAMRAVAAEVSRRTLEPLTPGQRKVFLDLLGRLT